MPAQRISQMTGMMPRRSRRLLPDGGAQVASNCLMTAGDINPNQGPLTVQTLVGATVKSIFRMYASGVDYWLQWASQVDAVKGPVTGDTTFRTYFTSSAFEPRVTNFALATASTPYPAGWYVLGVTPPVAAPALTVVGGSGSTESRVYVNTFVTQWGEESAPSASTAVVSGFINGSWNLSGMEAAPSNTYAISALAWAGGVLTATVGSTFGLRAGEYCTLSLLAPAVLNASYQIASVVDATHFTITMANPGAITDGVGTATRDAPHNTTNMTRRIYRSVTTGSGTNYFFVAEISAGTTTYNDTLTTVGGALVTIGWAMPPVDLQGIIVHPSGAMVGFSKNALCWSYPSAPYAWPIAYQQVTDYNIVGIGIFGQSVVVGTSGNPYVSSGVDPVSASTVKLDAPWPCLSKYSMVSQEFGVLYACPQGLASIGASGSGLVTQDFYTQVEWAALYPSTFIAVQHDGRYYAAGFTGVFVFGQGVNTSEPTLPSCVYNDPGTGYLYMVVGNVLYQWLADTTTRANCDWWSKEYVIPDPVNLGAAKLDADFTMSTAQTAARLAAYNAAVAANAALIAAKTSKGSMNGLSMNGRSLNGSLVTTPPSLAFDSLSFTLYNGQSAIYSTPVVDSNIFRLPAGVKYDAYAVRIAGNVPVKAILVGPNPLSLRRA